MIVQILKGGRVLVRNLLPTEILGEDRYKFSRGCDQQEEGPEKGGEDLDAKLYVLDSLTFCDKNND